MEQVSKQFRKKQGSTKEPRNQKVGHLKKNDPQRWTLRTVRALSTHTQSHLDTQQFGLVVRISSNMTHGLRPIAYSSPINYHCVEGSPGAIGAQDAPAHDNVADTPPQWLNTLLHCQTRRKMKVKSTPCHRRSALLRKSCATGVLIRMPRPTGQQRQQPR